MEQLHISLLQACVRTYGLCRLHYPAGKVVGRAQHDTGSVPTTTEEKRKSDHLQE